MGRGWRLEVGGEIFVGVDLCVMIKIVIDVRFPGRCGYCMVVVTGGDE